MSLLGIETTGWALIISILVFSGVLYWLFRSTRLKPLQFSFLLLIIYLVLNLVLYFIGESSPKVTLYVYVGSLLILSLAIIKLFLKLFIVYFLEMKQEISVPKIMQDLLQLGAFLVIAVIILHEYFRLDTSILVTSSVLSIVIGLALQDTLGNFFAGLALQMQKPFEKGDWILFGDQLGQVTDIDWRAIKIRTLNRDQFTIPNSEIAKSSFVNYSKPTKLHRIVIPMGVSYKSPPNFVKQIIMEILEEDDEILKYPKPSILLVRYNDFSIDYEIRVFTDNFRRFKEITDKIYTKIWYRFKRNDISIPFPIRDVYLHEVQPEEPDEITGRIIESLKCVDFLSALKDNELKILADGVIEEHHAANELVVRQGEPGNSFYIIESGEVEVFYTDESGKKISLRNLIPPAFFGELSLLTGSERTATVVCVRDTILFKVDSQTFKTIIMDNPKIADRVSDIIISRKHELDRLTHAHIEAEATEDTEKESFNLLRKMKNFFGF